MNVATLQVSGSLESKFNYHVDVALYYFVCFGASSRGRNSVLPALEVKSRSGHCQTEKEEQFYILQLCYSSMQGPGEVGPGFGPPLKLKF